MVSFHNFVADAPENDAGVIAIAIDHGDQVRLAPLVVEPAVTIFFLGQLPLVEGFVHDEKSHLIAQVEKLRRGRIMRGAQRVASHALQKLQLPLVTPAQGNGAETPEIGVIANTLDLHVLAVEKKALVLGEDERADAERRRHRIGEHTLHPDFGDGVIKNGCFAGPKFGVGKRNGLIERRVPLRRHRLRGFLAADLLAIRIEQPHGEDRFARRGTVVVNLRLHADVRAIHRGLGRRDVGAPLCNVNRFRGDQPDIAIESRSRIPPATRLLHVQAHGEDILFAAKVSRRRQVIIKAAEAIRTIPEEFSIQPDLAVHVSAVEKNNHVLVPG